MNKTEKRINEYETVSEDIKFVSNSLIRLKILKELYEKPRNMKELTEITDLKYSSISTTLHALELKDMVYRKSNRYCMVESLKLQMDNILQLSIMVNLLEEIFNIIYGHVVENLPIESIFELYLLNQVELLESDGINVDQIINFIETNLKEAEVVHCISPIYYDEFNQILDDLVKNDKYVEIKVSKKLFEIYEDKSEVKFLSSFEGNNNFLLIVTDKIMILGFFKEDDVFDKNRILIASDEDGIKWANNLFKYFKKVNK